MYIYIYIYIYIYTYIYIGVNPLAESKLKTVVHNESKNNSN